MQCFHRYLPEDLEWAEIVILQRESNAHTLALIHKLQQEGKRILFDIDDLLTEVPRFLSVYDHCKKMRPYLQEALRMVDAVTVTTPRLQKEMQVYNDHVHVIPNCTFSDYAPSKHFETSDGKVNLIVASSDTIQLNFVVDALSQILADPVLNLQLIGIGPPAYHLKHVGLEVEIHETMKHDLFKSFLASRNNTIGIIPLDDSRFSHCKSALKFVDYALGGVVAVCSNVPPYSDLVIHGRTGILCKNEKDDWYRAIRDLAMSAKQRAALVEEARRFCLQEFSLDNASEAWHEVIRTTRPGQGRIGSPLLSDLNRTIARARGVFQEMLRPRAYRTALKIFREDGIQGIKARLRLL
jgi:glycosyltransferase involved in cell wall biosynthesis